MPAKRSSSSHSKSKSTKSKSKSQPTSKTKTSSGRKYSPKAQRSVATEMRHLKKGEHKNRKQAIAIGLSKARKAGAKVPRKAGKAA